MSKPIEQALSNLIPRHPGALPPELIELASSLLAQSRSKASTLNAEEEIGRTYACANIACERLKTTLNLPPIEPRPPVPPRIYNKLYAYLSRALPSSRRRKASQSQNTTPSRPLPQKQTPSKETSLSAFRRPTKKGLQVGSRKERDDRVPKWIAPVVRKMCGDMGTQGAVPHVLAGVESILTLPYPGEGERKMEGKIPALVVAVWFFVVQSGREEEMGTKEFGGLRNRILAIFETLKGDEGVVGKVGDEEEGWRGWEKVENRDVKGWIKEVVEGGWMELDWYTNIGGDVTVAGEEDEQQGTEPLIRKKELGMTMQDQYDYLSPESKAEYAHWNVLMLERIKELIAEGIMDVDT